MVFPQDARILGGGPLDARPLLRVPEPLTFPDRQHIHKDRLSGFVDRGHILVEPHHISNENLFRQIITRKEEHTILKNL